MPSRRTARKLAKWLAIGTTASAAILCGLFYLSFVMLGDKSAFHMELTIARAINRAVLGPGVLGNYNVFCGSVSLDAIVERRIENCSVASATRESRDHCRWWWLFRPCLAIRIKDYFYGEPEVRARIESAVRRPCHYLPAMPDPLDSLDCQRKPDTQFHDVILLIHPSLSGNPEYKVPLRRRAPD